jgi:nucleotide-binding universal stress UspA family protein
VALPIAERFRLPLTVVYERELTVPMAPELAFGAIDEDGRTILEVVLLHVVHSIPAEVIVGMPPVLIEEVEAQRGDVEEYLAALAAELRDKGIHVQIRVRRGEPATEIAAGARDAGADLVAMSTHGRGGLGRLVFGSVAQEVLRRVELPVVLMRATEAQVTARMTRRVRA